MLARINTLLAATEAAIEFPKDFVIPGSSKASSAIELARTIIRRAERWCVTLGREGLLPGEHLLAYLNRLADLLWLLARQAEKLEASATRSVSQTPVRD
jgi:cob(I)alamin adenosyltransferase